MYVHMQNAKSLNPGQIRQLLELSEGFAGQSRAEIYAFVERVVVVQQYARLAKKQRGAVRHYLSKVTGLSLPQIAPLIRSYRKSGKVEAQPYRRRGLRKDEIRRLRVGCTRENWKAGTASAQVDAVCNLDVPVNKTSDAFTKPVDQIVGESIRAWEAERPAQPAMIDEKTGELVHFLFAYRGNRPGQDYINHTLVPILCRKAGVPPQDARGRITSHRARSTIASQLFNAKDPMSLFELQRWLGHKWANSTQHYLDITPTKLAQSFRSAGYFARNVRAIDVLIDREVVVSGKAAREPWKFYDLGHGFCTYDFFVLMAATEGSTLAVPMWAIAPMFNGGEGERQS
jgi:hypothetical protein